MDDLNKRGPQDRSRISLSEDWEVKWWTESLGISVLQLKEAVKAVGNSVEKVREYIKKNNR
jgi:hypothetical protein